MFGAGYTGQWFCKAIRELDEGRGGAGGERRSAVRISASTRSREQAEGLEASGLVDDAHAFDLDEAYLGLDAAGQAALRSATHVLVTVPPVADRDRDPLLALHGDLLRSSARLRWVGYLSTTGVYGNHDGAWVDESSQTLKGVGEGRPAINFSMTAATSAPVMRQRGRSWPPYPRRMHTAIMLRISLPDAASQRWRRPGQ